MNTREEVKSVFVEGRLWTDKQFGNTYFSSRIMINGEVVLIMPMQYGYGDHYLHASLTAIRDSGLIPADTTRELREAGIDLYYSSKPVNKKDLFKVYGA